MYNRSGLVATPNASLHLAKLCRHFSHKVDAHWDIRRGEVDFGIGRCVLTASDWALDVECSAPREEDLDAVMQTVQSHLERFGQREALVLDWI